MTELLDIHAKNIAKALIDIKEESPDLKLYETIGILRKGKGSLDIEEREAILNASKYIVIAEKRFSEEELKETFSKLGVDLNSNIDYWYPERNTASPLFKTISIGFLILGILGYFWLVINDQSSGPTDTKYEWRDPSDY